MNEPLLDLTIIVASYNTPRAFAELPRVGVSVHRREYVSKLSASTTTRPTTAPTWWQRCFLR